MYTGKHVLEIENAGISLGSPCGAGIYCKDHILLVTRNGRVVNETEDYLTANRCYLVIEKQLNRLDTILALKPGQEYVDGVVKYVGLVNDRIGMQKFGYVNSEASHQSWYWTATMPKEHFRQLRSR